MSNSRAPTGNVVSRAGRRLGLGLDLADPRFDDSILSEFRARVDGGGLDQVVLDTLLERLAGWWRPAGECAPIPAM